MNYMEQIAQMLGVEFGEKFDILDGDGKIYDKNMKLTENGLLHDGESIQSLPFLLVSILTGNMEIKKRPWKPKLREMCYYINALDEIGRLDFEKDSPFLAMYKLGKIYPTKEEAKAHKEEDTAFWQEVRKELDE